MLHCNMTQSSHSDSASSLTTPVDRVADDRRSASAQVYRINEVWIVEPPQDMASTTDKMIFTGSQAQQLSLTYAFERFGNARFFPY
jgi:hypothetical protein